MFAGFRLISSTWRLHILDPHGTLPALSGSVIFCLWHNRLALSMRAWERFGRPNIHSNGLVALISASHDGGMLARALKYFDVESVRGSSSRRGAQAFLELTSWVEKNYSVAITPDGPRGPRYHVRDGIINLAQVSGLPIVPVSTFVRRKFSLKSWDGFQVPVPFARCEMSIGEPLAVPRDISEKTRAELKRELESRMLAITRD
jgi:lysophospholipid acyltransferase (LPLAT)-like uncharacterized protein